jgi:hypothetical protein
VVLGVLAALVAAGMVRNDAYTCWQAHPGLSPCMTNAYANHGQEGAHGCALLAPFSWARDVLAVLVGHDRRGVVMAGASQARAASRGCVGPMQKRSSGSMWT